MSPAAKKTVNNKNKMTNRYAANPRAVTKGASRFKKLRTMVIMGNIDEAKAIIRKPFLSKRNPFGVELLVCPLAFCSGLFAFDSPPELF